MVTVANFRTDTSATTTADMKTLTIVNALTGTPLLDCVGFYGDGRLLFFSRAHAIRPLDVALLCRNAGMTIDTDVLELTADVDWSLKNLIGTSARGMPKALSKVKMRSMAVTGAPKRKQGRPKKKRMYKRPNKTRLREQVDTPLITYETLESMLHRSEDCDDDG